MELERQLDRLEKHQDEVVSNAEKVSLSLLLRYSARAWVNDISTVVLISLSLFQFEDGSGSLPDPTLPLAHQLEFTLEKLRQQARTILDTQATCRSLDEVRLLHSTFNKHMASSQFSVS